MLPRAASALFLLTGLAMAGGVERVTAQSAANPAPSFEFPAGCEIGRDCWFYAYMDHDPSENYSDHMCGRRTYDTHKGTDIAPMDPAAPIAVLAAADGVVRGTRDGMDDAIMRVRDEKRMAAQCGNGVRLDHGGGWTSQYCHLQRGSVTVRTGDRVSAGQLLGRIGSSGRSDFRHLHFQVELYGRQVDPFNGERPATPPICDTNPDSDGSLWRAREVRELAGYVPSVIYRAGISTGAPDHDRALHDGYPDRASIAAEALVGYIFILGVSAGTTVDTRITGPGGERVFENRTTLERDRARAFSFTGTRRKSAAWTPGRYSARFRVRGEGPGGAFELETERTIVLE